MTTNKPEVKRYDCTSGGAQYCYGCYTMEEDELGDYVEWEAYEALQAECEELRKDAERYRWLKKSAFCNVWARGDGIALVVPRTPTASIDSKIDAEMAMENSND